MSRQAIVEIAVARKGGGKTFLTANDKIAPYIIDRPGWKARKVLIYDVNGEYTDKHCKEKLKVSWTAKPLALKDLAEWTRAGKNEVRRILPLDSKNFFTQDVDVMLDILITILKTFRNGLLLLEDINAYLVDVSSKFVISAITRNRQKNLDILIHYQTLRAIPPRVLGNMNIFRFHRVNENISTIESKLNNPELFYIAQALVNFKFKTNIYFYCYVDNEMDNIFGAFSKVEFWAACLVYLRENKPDIIRLAENRYGKGTETAYKHCINELEKRYYGNK